MWRQCLTVHRSYEATTLTDLQRVMGINAPSFATTTWDALEARPRETCTSHVIVRQQDPDLDRADRSLDMTNL
jgi:hypothetical protein